MDYPKGTIPHLIVEGAAQALEFYTRAFGGKEISRAPADDGKRLMHAEIEINGSAVYLADDFPEYCGGKSNAPKAFGGSPVSLHLNVPIATRLTTARSPPARRPKCLRPTCSGALVMVWSPTRLGIRGRLCIR